MNRRSLLSILAFAPFDLLRNQAASPSGAVGRFRYEAGKAGAASLGPKGPTNFVMELDPKMIEAIVETAIEEKQRAVADAKADDFANGYAPGL